MEQSKHPIIDSSVIVPVYSGEKVLPFLLESLSSQINNVPFEVILSDNGSSDSSLQIADRYISSIPNLRIIDSGFKRGKHYSLNCAINQAKSDRLILLDQDDVVNDSYVSAMSDALNYHPLVAAHMDSNKLNQQFEIPPRFAPLNQKIGKFAIKIAAGGTLGMTRNAFWDIGAFDETFNYSTLDVDFCCRAHNRGYDLQLVDNAILYYRFRESIKENYAQGFLYGKGNRAIERRYPGIRGPRIRYTERLLLLLKESIQLLDTSRKDREKLAHNIGKSVGYLIEDKLGSRNV